MSLRCKPFERRTGKRVRAELRASEKLWVEYCRVRKGRWQNLHLPPWLGRLMVPVYLGVILFSRTRSLEFMTGFLTLATLAVTFYQARSLRARLYDGPEVLVFRYFPISDGVIFRHQWRTFLPNSLWWILNFGTLDGLLAAKVGVSFPSSVFAGVAFGILQWLFLTAAAVCLVAFGRRQIFYTLATVFGAFAIGLFALASTQHPLVNWACRLSYAVPPLAWIFYAMGIGSGGNAFYELWPPLSSAALLALVPAAYRRLKTEYAPRLLRTEAEASRFEGQTASPAEERRALTEAQNAVANTIYERSFLAGFDWSKSGLLERFIAGRLNHRNRLVLEFLVAANPRWTTSLRGLAALLVFVTVACLIFPIARSGMAGFVAIFAVIFAFGTLFGQWRGLASVQGAGLQSPYYTVYPVAFRELLKVMLIVNVIRFACCLPILAIAAGLVGWKAQWDSAAATMIGLKVVALGFLLQPLLPIMFFSPGTNDTQKPLLLLTAVALIIGLGACATAFIVCHTLAVIVLTGLGFGLLSVIGLVLYGWMFTRNGFDLIPARLTKSTEHI